MEELPKKLEAKVEKHTLFWLIMVPIVALLAYGAMFSRTSDNEIFLPFFILSLGLWGMAFLGLTQLFRDLTMTKKYHFLILQESIDIEYFCNGHLEKSYHIARDNLASFEVSYWNNYGAITTTYTFKLLDGEAIVIKEDFGKNEKIIMDAFLNHMYFPKSWTDRLAKLKR